MHRVAVQARACSLPRAGAQSCPHARIEGQADIPTHLEESNFNAQDLDKSATDTEYRVESCSTHPDDAKRRQRFKDRQRSVLQRLRRQQSMDHSEPDPIRELHRLSTLDTSGTTNRHLDLLAKHLKLDRKTEQRYTTYKQAVAAQNRAVQNVLQGLHRKDWNRAFFDGWVELDKLGKKQASLDMQTVEDMVKFSRKQPESFYKEHWTTLRDTLLVPAAEREALLLNGAVGARASEVGDWIWYMLRLRRSRALYERVEDFWKAFATAAWENKELQAKRDTFKLLEVPTHLFNAVAATFVLADKPFIDFVKTYVQNLATPTHFNCEAATSAANYELQLAHSGKPSMRATAVLNRLAHWYDQLELVRIWARRGEYGIRAGCTSWRNRKDAKSLQKNWKRIKDALRPENKNDKWMEISWLVDSTEYRRRKDYEDQLQHRASVDTSETDAPVPEIDTSFDSKSADLDLLSIDNKDESLSLYEEDAENKSFRVAGRRQRDTPALFTPEIAASFVQSFFHLELVQEAEDVWHFVTEDLHLTPSRPMWIGLMLGYSHLRDPETVEHLFEQMQKEAKGGKKIVPDAVVWSILINSYFRANRVQEGIAKANELLNNEDVRNLYPNKKLPIRIYNVIINYLLFHGELAKAQNILASLKEQNIPLDIVTVNVLLRYYSRPRTHDLVGVSEVLKYVDEYSLKPDIVTFTTIFDALLRAGRTDTVERVEKIMANVGVRPTAITYSGLMNHLVKESIKNGNEHGMLAALQLLRRMQDMEKAGKDAAVIKPTVNTYTLLVQGFAGYSTAHDRPDYLDLAESLYHEMKSLDLQPDRIVYNALMSAHLGHDNPDQALQYFEKYRALKRRRQPLFHAMQDDLHDEKHLMSETVPLRTWQGLLTGLVKQQHWIKARDVLEEMYDLGIEAKSGSLQRLEDAIYANTGMRARRAKGGD